MIVLEENFQVFPAFNLTTLTNGVVSNSYDSEVDRFYVDQKLLMTIEEYNAMTSPGTEEDHTIALSCEIYPSITESCPIVEFNDGGTDGKRKVVYVRLKGLNGPYHSINNSVPPELIKPKTITQRSPKLIFHDVTSGVVRRKSDFQQSVIDCEIMVTRPALKNIYDFWLTLRGATFSVQLPNYVTDSASNFTLVSRNVQILSLTNKRISPAYWQVSYSLRLI